MSRREPPPRPGEHRKDARRDAADPASHAAAVLSPLAAFLAHAEDTLSELRAYEREPAPRKRPRKTRQS